MSPKERYSIRKREIGGKICHSICHDESGEVMHSSEDPVYESWRLYIEQSGLLDRISSGERLVIWDVGLGAGFNAMNVYRAYTKADVNDDTAVDLISFENDLEPINKALSNRDDFPHLDAEMVSTLIKEGQLSEKRFSWRLVYGEFLESFSTQKKPSLILYDPFSYKVDRPMWTFDTFKQIYSHAGQERCELFTYSASTAIRTALLLAGFFVARGLSTGRKKETTIALTQKAAKSCNYNLLDRSWLLRWERSSARLPMDLDDEELTSVKDSLYSHPQFE